MFHVPEQYRITANNPLASDSSYGNNGAFRIPILTGQIVYIIASDGEGWEHVSIHVHNNNGTTSTPNWNMMCKMKAIFWDEEDCVIQYHPPKSEYVNNHKDTLHLWRPINQIIPMPPSIMVGIKP